MIRLDFRRLRATRNHATILYAVEALAWLAVLTYVLVNYFTLEGLL